MTAVEWLQEQFLKHEIEIKDFEKYLFIKANELFEQQIKDAYNRGYQDATNDYRDMGIFEDAELYFNETYKK
jgi:hypothetical protein